MNLAAIGAYIALLAELPTFTMKHPGQEEPVLTKAAAEIQQIIDGAL